MSKYIKTISLSVMSVFIVGCSNATVSTPTIQKQIDTNATDNSNLIIEQIRTLSSFKKNDDLTIERIKKYTKIDHRLDENDISEQMLIDNPDYIKSNTQKALIANKKLDISLTKPAYLEPIFSKVEILPYTAENGLYFEQQSVWLKVVDGEIALKTNRASNGDLSIDQFQNILDR